MYVQDLNPDSPTPQRALVDRRSDLLSTMLLLVRKAHTQICCMHHTLEPLGLSSSAVVASLERFLSTHPGARVRLLADDAHWLDTQAPRLRTLQRALTHALEIRIASPSDPIGEDVAVIVDHEHVLNLKIAKIVQGELSLHHPANAQSWSTVFDRRWAHAGHNLPATPLGL